jgi:hypothetical protein
LVIKRHSFEEEKLSRRTSQKESTNNKGIDCKEEELEKPTSKALLSLSFRIKIKLPFFSRAEYFFLCERARLKYP